MANVEISAGESAPVIFSTAPETERGGPLEAVPSPQGALRDGGVLLRELIDLCVAAYAGRDTSRPQRYANRANELATAGASDNARISESAPERNRVGHAAAVRLYRGPIRLT